MRTGAAIMTAAILAVTAALHCAMYWLGTSGSVACTDAGLLLLPRTQPGWRLAAVDVRGWSSEDFRRREQDLRALFSEEGLGRLILASPKAANWRITGRAGHGKQTSSAERLRPVDGQQGLGARNPGGATH